MDEHIEDTAKFRVSGFRSGIQGSTQTPGSGLRVKGFGPGYSSIMGAHEVGTMVPEQGPLMLVSLCLYLLYTL